jgi:Zinc carboxypeptidase
MTMRHAGLILALSIATAAAQAAQVPKPEEVLGFRPGTDYKLAGYDAIVRYFRALDAASDRVTVFDIGPTAEGRTMIAAAITSEANQKKLGRYREISRRLALARNLTDAQARALAEEGRAVVWIDSGLHASEVAHAQHAPELAYRVATEDSPEMRRIREEVILLQVPVMNPDGLETVVRWYERNRGTPYEVAPMVELYHKYVGHDNNRDWYMLQMPESRNVAKLLYEEWFPQIVYNHHQTAPFPARIFVPPFADPMNPNIPPQVMRGIHTVGDAITARLEREGKGGAVSRVGFDTWWNGGMRTAPYFHNMIGILTETALWRYATPHEYDPKRLPKRFRDGATPADAPSTYYPSPWKGGWWRLRDAVDYMLTASLAVLDVGARQRSDWLYGMYQMGRDAIAAGQKGDPYAYVIEAPATQADPAAALKLAEVLARGGVEVQRAKSSFKSGDKEHPAGSLVVLMAQPFRAHAKDLLEVQKYPERRQGASGPPQAPYDIAGWTLPAQMGVKGGFVAKAFTADLEPVASFAPAPGRVTGSGNIYLVSPTSNESFKLVNRVIAGGGEVRRARGKFHAGKMEFEPGTFMIVGGLSRQAMEAFARESGLDIPVFEALDDGRFSTLKSTRIGLYKPWVPNIDEGWTRFLMERYEFPFRNVTDGEIRQGNLVGSFDTIVIPDAPLKSLLDGHLPGSVPAEYAGGLGLEGALALKDFVQRGGTLITLESASELATDLFGVGVKNSLKGVPRQDYYCPGSLLKLKVDNTQPLAYGLPAETIVFAENGPAFEEDGVVDEEGEEQPQPVAADRPTVRFAAHFVDKDVLHSGWLLGESKIAKKAALAEVRLGVGRVILIAFRPQFRAQPYGTFKVLFNALLLPD